MKRLLSVSALLVQMLVVSTSSAQQSDITLYGVVDTAVASTHAREADGLNRSSNGMLSGGYGDSLFGLRGSEPLREGWRAEFLIESRFDSTTGMLDDDTSFFNNSAWLGLSHAQYGSLRLGRQQTVAQQFASQLEIAPWKDMGMGATFKASDNHQLNNSVNYLSPSVGGFSVGLGYSFDVLGDQISGRRSPHGSVALQYEQGPLLVVASWDKTWLADSVLADAPDPSAWQLDAAYDFDVARVSLAWSRQSNGYTGLDGGDPDGLGLGLGARAFALGGRLDSYLVGVSVPVGTAGEVLAQWSYVRPHWDWEDGEAAQAGQVATLGYVHGLSPRTRLYLMAGVARHYSLDDQIVRNQGNTTRYMAGMNHSF